jgi:hypothetical protein
VAIADSVQEYVQRLPPALQAQVLDFAKYLLYRVECESASDQDDWSVLSVSMAMRGLEEEDSPYTEDDIKEPYL